jgi:hypothetical protein
MALALLKTPVGVTISTSGNLIKCIEKVAIQNVAEIVPQLLLELEETKRLLTEKVAATAEEHRGKLAEMTRTVLVQEIHALRARVVLRENQLAGRFNDAVVECLQHLIGEHLSDAFIEHAIHAAIKSNGFVSEAKLVVSVADEHVARAVVEDLQQARLDLRIFVEADPQLSQGTCWFLTAAGKIDATLDTQLAAIRHALGMSDEGRVEASGAEDSHSEALRSEGSHAEDSNVSAEARAA